MTATTLDTKPGKAFVYRHTVLVRITHWINVICIIFLVMSGAQIFNARPDLYWGQKSDFDHPLLSMEGLYDSQGQLVQGRTTIFGHAFNTTGVLGMSYEDGQPSDRGFPSWFTVPTYRDLATGRRWHFFFAWIFVINGLIYLVSSLINGHLKRDLVPSDGEIRGIGHSIWDHIRLRFDHGRAYNVLQKLAYLGIVAVVLPLLVLAGLTMSPGLDSQFPILLQIFGGRQTARTVHFICASLVVLFVIVHIVMVLISGVWNNIRSMITGRYAVRESASDE